MRFTTKKHLGMYGIIAIIVTVSLTFTMTINPIPISYEIPGVPHNPTTNQNSTAEIITALRIPVTMPTYLPNGVVFESGHAATDGQSAHVIFSNGNMTVEYSVQKTTFNPLQSRHTSVLPIVVTVIDQGKVVSVTEHSQTDSDYVVTTMNGVEALIVEGDIDDSRKIVWYDNNDIFHIISADISHAELIRIGNSMAIATE